MLATIRRPIAEATGGTGRKWSVTLIESGWSANGRYYPAAVLQAAVAAKLFDGAPCFADHSTPEERRERPERSIRDKIGLFGTAVYESTGANKGRVVSTLTVLAPWFRDLLAESDAAGEQGFVGFSIQGVGPTEVAEADGRRGQIVRGLKEIWSVDAVTVAAAGGRLGHLVASAAPSHVDVDPSVELIQEAEKLLLISGDLKESGRAHTVPEVLDAFTASAFAERAPTLLREVERIAGGPAPILTFSPGVDAWLVEVATRTADEIGLTALCLVHLAEGGVLEDMRENRQSVVVTKPLNGRKLLVVSPVRFHPDGDKALQERPLTEALVGALVQSRWPSRNQAEVLAGAHNLTKRLFDRELTRRFQQREAA